jgi:Rrf2 family transcriptional regulator, nitric oxide-sensitive transcriptional repressor
VRLTSHTDYSLRVLIYLALNGDRRSNVSEIAARFRISRNHLVKVIHGLGRGGFLHSYRGKGGGIVLAHAPTQINIGRVVRYTEGPMQLVECFRSGNRCVITGSCVLADALREASDSFLAVLDRFTLADMVAERASLVRLLKIKPATPPRASRPNAVT